MSNPTGDALNASILTITPAGHQHGTMLCEGCKRPMPQTSVQAAAAWCGDCSNAMVGDALNAARGDYCEAVRDFAIALGRPHLATAFRGDGKSSDEDLAYECGKGVIQIALGLATPVGDFDSEPEGNEQAVDTIHKLLEQKGVYDDGSFAKQIALVLRPPHHLYETVAVEHAVEGDDLLELIYTALETRGDGDKAKLVFNVMRPYLSPTTQATGRDEVEAWKAIANAKPRVKWRRGIPPASGLYLVRLADRELIVTSYNDGTGKNRDTWGDDRQTGWSATVDASVVAWIPVADLKSLPCDSLKGADFIQQGGGHE